MLNADTGFIRANRFSAHTADELEDAMNELADLGMEHVYIKPQTPQLNGKVERSHRTDKDEFYQLRTYRGNVNLEKKLTE